MPLTGILRSRWPPHCRKCLCFHIQQQITSWPTLYLKNSCWAHWRWTQQTQRLRQQVMGRQSYHKMLSSWSDIKMYEWMGERWIASRENFNELSEISQDRQATIYLFPHHSVWVVVSSTTNYEHSFLRLSMQLWNSFRHVHLPHEKYDKPVILTWNATLRNEHKAPPENALFDTNVTLAGP